MAAILERDAGSPNHHAGAEPHVVGLDKGDHISLSVGAAEVDGAALGRDRMRVDPGRLPHLCALRAP